MNCVGRFAPSPSGRMHLGNVYAALLSWLSVKSKGGDWILRIEDVDPQRSKVEHADMIRSDLEWLGLAWDEEYVQSQRFDIYKEHLERLNVMGMLYPCRCTRADIMATQAPHESDGRVVYRGTCRPEMMTVIPSLDELVGEASVRLMVPDEDVTFVDGICGQQTINLAKHCGDFILRRKDGAWAYQLAVVVDDALMGVTEVVRGCDLLLSVPQQLLLYRLFGYDAPEFYHVPLLVNADGQRLSKRDRSMDMGVLRSMHTPESLLGDLAHRIGLTKCAEPVGLDELLGIYSASKQ